MKEKCLFILMVLVLMTAPAFAGFVHVSDADEASTFGSASHPDAIATMSSSSSPGPIGFVLSIEARVWLNEEGTYTYVYEFSDNGTSFGGITSITIYTGDFDATLDWGTVGSPLGSTVDMIFGGSLTFQFNPGVASGSTTTVYAQSTMAPQLYNFSGWGFGPSGADQQTWGADPIDEPQALPEAPSFFLLGTGLLGLGFLRQRFN